MLFERPTGQIMVLLVFGSYVMEAIFPGCGGREDLGPLVKILAAAAPGELEFLSNFHYYSLATECHMQIKLLNTLGRRPEHFETLLSLSRITANKIFDVETPGNIQGKHLFQPPQPGNITQKLVLPKLLMNCHSRLFNLCLVLFPW